MTRHNGCTSHHCLYYRYKTHFLHVLRQVQINNRLVTRTKAIAPYRQGVNDDCGSTAMWSCGVNYRRQHSLFLDITHLLLLLFPLIKVKIIVKIIIIAAIRNYKELLIVNCRCSNVDWLIKVLRFHMMMNILHVLSFVFNTALCVMSLAFIDSCKLHLTMTRDCTRSGDNTTFCNQVTIYNQARSFSYMKSCKH